jgi:hypothetical protein
MKLLLANLIIDAGKYSARKLKRQDLVSGHSTHDLQRFISKLTETSISVGMNTNADAVRRREKCVRA